MHVVCEMACRAQKKECWPEVTADLHSASHALRLTEGGCIVNARQCGAHIEHAASVHLSCYIVNVPLELGL